MLKNMFFMEKVGEKKYRSKKDEINHHVEFFQPISGSSNMTFGAQNFFDNTPEKDYNNFSIL